MLRRNEAMASNENKTTVFLLENHILYGNKENEETLASCSRTLNASFEKALEISFVNISTDTSPTEQSSNMSLPSVRQMAKDFEEKRKIFEQQQQRPYTSGVLSEVLSNGMALSPIPNKNDSEESPPPQGNEKRHCIIGPICLTTPPKILRKDADHVLSPHEMKNAEHHVNEKDLFDTPERQAFLSEAPFQYDTPPQKKLFSDEDAAEAIYFGHLVPSTGVENEVDTPKTCNTSNLSSSFLVSQIAFDANKMNAYVDPEESFETFYSHDSNANRQRSYLDDTFDSSTPTNIREHKDLPSRRQHANRSPTTLFGRVENLFYSQVDTLVDRFVMACVQEKDVRTKNNKTTTATKLSKNKPSASSETKTDSRQPSVATV